MSRSESMTAYRLWLAFTLCLLGVVAGCTGTTTRIAGWYVTRQIDGYVDLTGEQKELVRARVDVLIEEIRRDELPKALYLMRLVRDAIAQNQVQDRIDGLQERSDAFLERAAGRLIPELGWLLSQLDDAQITYFEGKLKENVDKIYEDQQLPQGERRKKMDEQLVEGLEKAVGDLSAAQQQTILQAAHALPDDRAQRYRNDLARIQSTGKLLRAHPGQAAVEAELRRLWATRYEVTAGRDKLTRRAEQREFLLSVDRTMTEQQRAHAVESLNERIRSLARFELHAEATSAPN
ncbi:MAG: DUF6279 family lipoprotein [Myxococcales bacterium]